MNAKPWMFVLAACLALPAAAQDDAERKDKEGSSVEAPADTESKGSKKHLEKLSAEFGVTEARLVELREKGMGWGEIGHALAIAQKSGKPLDDVLKLRESGMGWGEIAKQYGFKLGEIKGNAKKAEALGKKADALKKKEGAAHAAKAQGRAVGPSGTRGRPAHAGGPKK